MPLKVFAKTSEYEISLFQSKCSFLQQSSATTKSSLFVKTPNLACVVIYLIRNSR